MLTTVDHDATIAGQAPPFDLADHDQGVTSLATIGKVCKSTSMEIDQGYGENVVSEPQKKPSLSRPSNSLILHINAIKTTPGMSRVYEIDGKGSNIKIRLVRRNLQGYRYHPLTIKELHSYHCSCFMHGELDPNALVRLIGLLVQDSSIKDVVTDVWNILCNTFIQPFTLTKDNLAELVYQIATCVNYGPPWLKPELLNWELKNAIDILPAEISELILEDQTMRRLYSMLLVGDANIVLVEENNVHTAIDTPVMSQAATPISREKIEKSDKKLSQRQTLKGNAKLSSFFNVVKKDHTSDSNRENHSAYFQPFFAKHNMKLAPITFFSTSLNDHVAEFGWESFRSTIKRVPQMRRRPCRCIGFDSKPVFAIAKLIQFHENYRPAYFGTMRNFQIAAGGLRNPFRRLMDLDYEVDSDDDWGDDAEIEDAESISESEGNEDESMQSELFDEDDTGWLVPDGYISDDEGLEIGHEPKEKRPITSIDDSSITRAKFDVKRRYIEKNPVIIGPFMFRDDSYTELMPLEISAIQFHWVDSNETGSIDPFEGISINSMEDEGQPKEVKPLMTITDDMLSDLARIANGSFLGVTRLFELFSANCGKVSRRQFEFRLNQIAAKTRSDDQTKASWIIRPEFIYLLRQNSM